MRTRQIVRGPGLALLAAAVMAGGSIARAQNAGQGPSGATQPPTGVPAEPKRPVVGADFWNLPAGAVAFVAFAPTVLTPGSGEDPLRALVEAGARGMIASCANVDRGTSVVTALLRPSVLGEAPYRVCLTSLKLVPTRDRPGVEPQTMIEGLGAVVEVRIPPPHDRLEALVLAALKDDERTDRAAGGRIGPATIAGATRASAYTRAGDGPARRVEWASTASAFYVGLGEGSLAGWLARGEARGEWLRHRSQVQARRGSSTPVAEAFLDLNALRAAAPEEFARGRFGKLAEALRIANARSAMLHVRLPRPLDETTGQPIDPAPGATPLLAIDVSWSSRSEPPGTVASAAISEKSWSDVPGIAPPATPARFAVLLRSDWPTWLAVIGDVYAAASGKAGDEFVESRSRWLRRHGPTLERFTPVLGTPVVVLARVAGGTGTPSGPAITIVLSPQRDVKPEADLRELMSSLDARIRYAAASRTWTMTLGRDAADRDGTLSAWSWALNSDATAILVDTDAARVSSVKGRAPK